jgi:hypothetical protein
MCTSGCVQVCATALGHVSDELARGCSARPHEPRAARAPGLLGGSLLHNGGRGGARVGGDGDDVRHLRGAAGRGRCTVSHSARHRQHNAAPDCHVGDVAPWQRRTGVCPPVAPAARTPDAALTQHRRRTGSPLPYHGAALGTAPARRRWHQLRLKLASQAQTRAPCRRG